MAHHISIERAPSKTGPKPRSQEPESSKQLLTLLFGGNKGYDWMVSFLGLMDTIKLKPTKSRSVTKELMMT